MVFRNMNTMISATCVVVILVMLLNQVQAQGLATVADVQTDQTFAITFYITTWRPSYGIYNLPQSGTPNCMPQAGNADIIGHDYIMWKYKCSGIGTIKFQVSDGSNQRWDTNVFQTYVAIPVTVSFPVAMCANSAPNSAQAVVEVNNAGINTYTFAWSPASTDVSFTGHSLTRNNLGVGDYTVLVSGPIGSTDPATVVSFSIKANPEITATYTATAPSCSGVADGTVTVTGIGGSGSFTYNFGGGASSTNTKSGLSAGSHSVVITDASGCTYTLNYNIPATSPISFVQPSSQNPSCSNVNDGWATVVRAAGGTGALSYAWTNSLGTNLGNKQSISRLGGGVYTLTITDANGCTAQQQFTLTQPSAFSLNLQSASSPTCRGGSNGAATLSSATNAQGSVTYTWSDGQTGSQVSNLAVGTHTVTGQDTSGCKATLPVTITDTAALSLTATPVSPTCHGGSDGAVTTTGGLSGMTYLWSNGDTSSQISGVSAGTYVVTGTSTSGCTVTATATIADPAPFTASISSTNPTCNNGNTGTASATAVGATSYLWSDGQTTATATNLKAGTYQVTATDTNGCTAKAVVTLTAPAAFSVTIAGTNPTCKGGNTGSATATPSGGVGAISYVWSNGQTTAAATNLKAGTYQVTATDTNGCIAKAVVTLSEPGAMTVSATTTNVVCYGTATGAAQLSSAGGVGAVSYSWVTGQTGATVSGLAAGLYVVTGTDANGCTADGIVTINQPSSPFTASISSSTNAVCPGGTGTATATTSGASGAVTYSWSNGQTSATATGLKAGSHVVTVTDAASCSTTAVATITEPSTPFTLVVTNTVHVGCHGGNNGAATVAASGGSGTVTYTWSNGQTGATALNLVAGTYTVYASTNLGCTTSTTVVTITEPAAALAVTSSQVNVGCHGQQTGSATVTASGGTSAYTYLWSNGASTATASALGAGSYSVTVTDAHQCTQTASYTITEPAALTVSVTTNSALCKGEASGSAQASVSGGTSGYSYLWSNGATGGQVSDLAAASYSITVTDSNSCTQSANFIISEPSNALAATASVTKDVSCHGGSDGTAQVTASGGTSGYTYLWSNGATTATASSLAAGTYKIIVKDANQCAQTLVASVSQPPALSATAVPSHVRCHGDHSGSASVVAFGGTPSYTYLWGDGSTTASISKLAVGTYTVTVTDSKQCTQSTSVTLTEPAPLAAVVQSEQDNVCYLGSKGYANISISGGVTPYTYNWMSQTNGNTTELSGASAGNYTFMVTDENGCTAFQEVHISEPALYCKHGDCIGMNLCSCFNGWNGSDCSTPICEAACQNNGICSSPGYCSCVGNFTGPVCDIPIYTAAGTQRATYIVTLVQAYNSSANVSISTYEAMLAAKLNISTENVTVTSTRKGDITQLTSSIYLEVTPVSKNKTGDNVLGAVNTTDINNYLRGDTNTEPLSYVSKVELDVQLAAAPKPPKNNNGHNRRVKLGVGIGIGLGLPLVVAAIVTAVYFSKKSKDVNTTKM